jgi:O-antigen/teichoic acid export membrane protein
LGKVVNFLLIPLYTQYLVPADYGVLAMLAILSMFFAPLATVGMTSAIFREFNLATTPQRRRVVLTTGLTSITLLSLALFALAQVFAVPLSTLLLGSASLAGIIRLSLTTQLLSTVAQVPMVVLRARRQVRQAALFNLVKLVVSASLTIWLVVGLQLGVVGVVVGELAAEALIAAILFSRTLRQYRVRPQLTMWRTMLRYGLPFLPHRLEVIATVTFSQYVLRHYLGMEELGIYNVAQRFATPLVFAVSSIQRAWVPFKFQVHAEGEEPEVFFRRTFSYYILMLSYLWLGVSIWGPELVRLMTPEEYHRAGMLLPVVALVACAQGLYFMLGTGIELTENTRALPLVGLGALLAVVITAVPAVLYAGAYGAALSTGLGWLVMATVIYFASQRQFKIHYDWGIVIGIAVAAGAGVAASALAQQAPLGWRLAVAALLTGAFPAVTLGLLLRSPSERRATLQLLRMLRRTKGEPEKQPPQSSQE